MELITSILPHAAGVALSPLGIAAIIFLLLSKRAKLNSISFLLGWVAALIVNVGLFMIIFDKPVDSATAKSTILVLTHLILGLILIFFAFKEFKSRPEPGNTPTTPKWMGAIDNMSPIMAFVIGFGLVTINAKNTVVDIAAGVLIGQGASSIDQALVALAVYTIVASSSIFIPVFGFFVLGEKLNSKLEKLKTWFLYHNASILFVLFLILGLELISKAF